MEVVEVGDGRFVVAKRGQVTHHHPLEMAIENRFSGHPQKLFMIYRINIRLMGINIDNYTHNLMKMSVGTSALVSNSSHTNTYLFIDLITFLVH